MKILEVITDLENNVYHLNKELKYDEALTLSMKNRNLIAQQGYHIPDYILGIHIINRIGVLLNMNDLRMVEQELRFFDTKMDGKKVTEEILFRRYYLECEVMMRIGCYDSAINIADKALTIIKSSKKRCELYLIKGRAELAQNKNCFQITSLSDALAEAENAEDQSLIAQVYMDLAHMFGMRYGALAIYFLRKAEVIYKRCNDNYGLNNEYMYRAMCNLLVYERLTHNEKTERLKQEAERLVKMVDEKLFRTESNKWYFQRLKAYVFKEEDLLDEVLEYYKFIGAEPEIARTVEMYISICLNKGLNDKVKTILPLYKDNYTGKENILKHIANLEDLLNKGVKVNFMPPFDNSTHEPTLLDILDRISFNDEIWALDNNILRSLFPAYIHEGLFETIVMPNGKVCLFPCSPSVNSYYRGQNAYFEECKPALYRDGLTEADIFVERLKYAELKLLIQSHPIHDIYDSGLAATLPNGKKPISLNIDYLALAQHYGIKTELLDLTVDKFVAAFFACTDYNEKTDSYSVHLGNDGYGVYYTYFSIEDLIPFQEACNSLRVVGLQPFSRPGEQAGYALQMKKGENFNTLCREAIRFRHDEDVARFIFNYTNRQKRLFPKGILEEKIPTIKGSNKFSRKALELAVAEFYPNVDNQIITRYLNDRNISISETPIVNFSEEEINEFWKNWKERDEQRFFDKVFIRPTYIPQK